MFDTGQSTARKPATDGPSDTTRQKRRRTAPPDLGHEPGRPALEPQELSTSRCRELLARHRVGRVAWSAAHGPQLYPVSYICAAALIIFRTSPYGTLSELVQPTDVIFEVDELDPAVRAGWSVLVRGRAEGLAAPRAVEHLLMGDEPLPWAGGSRNLFIGITPRFISGRHFAPTGST